MDFRTGKLVFLVYSGWVLFCVPLVGLLSEGFAGSYWVSVARTMLIIDSMLSVILIAPFLLFVKIWYRMGWFEVFNWVAILGLVLFGAGFGLWSFEVAYPPPARFCPLLGCSPTPQETAWQNLYNLGVLLASLGTVFLIVAVARLRVGPPSQTMQKTG
jgi:hypothetical protein